MHRTQILLDDWQYEQLKIASQRENRSISSLVRDAVSRFLGRGEGKPATRLSDISGLGADRKLCGRDHDDVLYGPKRGRS